MCRLNPATAGLSVTTPRRERVLEAIRDRWLTTAQIRTQLGSDYSTRTIWEDLRTMEAAGLVRKRRPVEGGRDQYVALPRLASLSERAQTMLAWIVRVGPVEPPNHKEHERAIFELEADGLVSFFPDRFTYYATPDGHAVAGQTP